MPGVTFSSDAARRIVNAVRGIESTSGKPAKRTPRNSRAWRDYIWVKTPAGGIDAATEAGGVITPGGPVACNPFVLDPSVPERALDASTDIEVYNFFKGDIAADTNIRIAWVGGIWEVVGEDCET